MKVKIILWYIFLVVAVALLVTAFIRGSALLTAASCALAFALRRTNKHIPLPEIYRKAGVRNDAFEGRLKR